MSRTYARIVLPAAWLLASLAQACASSPLLEAAASGNGARLGREISLARTAGELDARATRQIATMFIIAQMMGIPREHYDRFHTWSDDLIGSTTATPDNPGP